MTDRPPEYEGLPTQDKIIFELRLLGDKLDRLIGILAPEPEVIEVREPNPESDFLMDSLGTHTAPVESPPA